MTTLVKYGTTPTGFGLRQRRNGQLRPTSKCCGRSMDGHDVRCKGCGASHLLEERSQSCSLSRDVQVAVRGEAVLTAWVSRVTGYDDIVVRINT